MTMEGFFFPREDVTEDDEDDDDGVDAQAHTEDDDDVDGNASFLECNHMCQWWALVPLQKSFNFAESSLATITCPEQRQRQRAPTVTESSGPAIP